MTTREFVQQYMTVVNKHHQWLCNQTLVTKSVIEGLHWSANFQFVDGEWKIEVVEG